MLRAFLALVAQVEEVSQASEESLALPSLVSLVALAAFAVFVALNVRGFKRRVEQGSVLPKGAFDRAFWHSLVGFVLLVVVCVASFKLLDVVALF